MKEYRLSPNGNLYTYDEFMEKIKDLNMHNDDIQFINMLWEGYPVIPVKNKRQLERLRFIYKKPDKGPLSLVDFFKDQQDIMMWGSAANIKYL